ncbi:MAG: diphosphomevalonate decarboxylase [Bacteroidetes bacterium]|jgi:diphosphomevalonate decarboxylase|nr:diphosphomevalonate decarboxylase [Bacteroidota bacterium]
MTKATVEAPSNIAFLKYWGAEDLEQAIPRGPSLSMTLHRCASRTTAVFEEGAEGEDTLLLADTTAPDDAPELSPAPEAFAAPVRRHLDRLRDVAGRAGTFTIATHNSFPSAAGLASSASGFAALTLAALRALEHPVSPTEASVLARRSGSGSAARSVMGGYVAWPEGPDHAATQVAPPDHWDLRDVIALVETTPKKVSSRDGHRRAPTSPFFEQRIAHLPARLDAMETALQDRDFARLGTLIERDSTELHLITMSSVPPIFYWAPATLAVLEAVRALRADGVPAYGTMDAGANVHVICEPVHEDTVAARLAAVDGVHRVLRDGVGAGPRTDVPALL